MDEGKGKKCKGVKENVVKKKIAHEDYRNCLFGRKKQMRKMNCIRSRGHEVFTETVYKIASSADDDKRVILEDEISALAIGHWRLK